MVDGSGLSRDNRAPCSLELATLSLMSQPRFAWIRKGIVGRGGARHARDEPLGTPLQGKLTAKTGSLNGVAGLTGFIDIKLPLEFSLLLNGSFSEGTGSDGAGADGPSHRAIPERSHRRRTRPTARDAGVVVSCACRPGAVPS